jgi:hypothetical protein
VAGSAGSGDGAPWRVFISHTSELRELPTGRSYVAAVERAISAAGHVIVDMADFPATGQPPAQVCIDRVRGCDVYVGVFGTRYGSPVRDKPEVSYTELEFDTATEVGLERLAFLLDTRAANVGIAPEELIDREFGARQEAFRARVRESGLTTQSFVNPDALGQLVERSLRDLAQKVREAAERKAQKAAERKARKAAERKARKAAERKAQKAAERAAGFMSGLRELALQAGAAAGEEMLSALAGQLGAGEVLVKLSQASELRVPPYLLGTDTSPPGLSGLLVVTDRRLVFAVRGSSPVPARDSTSWPGPLGLIKRAPISTFAIPYRTISKATDDFRRPATARERRKGRDPAPRSALYLDLEGSGAIFVDGGGMISVPRGGGRISVSFSREWHRASEILREMRAQIENRAD